MTHQRGQNIVMFLQGFFGVTAMGSGLILMLHAAANGGGWGAVGPLLQAMAIIVTGGIILAPGLARAVASPTGRLFYPQKPLEPKPLVSLAQGLRQNGRFEEALEEYQRVVAEFPDSQETYSEMIDMAVSDMADQALGRALLLKALVTVTGERARQELRDCFDCACAARVKEKAGNPRIAFDLFEDETEGVDGE